MFRSLNTAQALLATFGMIVAVAVPPLGLTAILVFAAWLAIGSHRHRQAREEARMMNKAIFFKGGPWA